MTMGLILLIVLIFLLLGAFPMGQGYNRSWGYGPSGIIGVLLVVLLILVLLGRI